MGCWNQTCMVTQSPIWSGEVKYFVLQKEHAMLAKSLSQTGLHPVRLKGNIGDCHSWDTWKPIGLPLDGIYDSYGGATNFEQNTAFEVTEKFFQDNHGFSVQDLYGKLHSGEAVTRILAYDGDNEIRGSIFTYGIAMVPTEIYNAIVTTARNIRSVDLIKHALQFAPETTEIIPTPRLVQKAASFFARSNMLGIVTDIDAVYAADPDAVKDFFLFMFALDDLRVPFSPQCGQGSQNADYELHIERMKIGIRYCENEIKKREE